MWQIIGQVVEQHSRSEPGRLVFIDALRLLAALQMIVGHTLDALLADALRSGPAFRVWTFARGLTSTAFFCAAGFSFSIASRGPRGRAGRTRRLRRAAELLAVGYALRLPLGVLWGEPVAVALRSWLAPDVLHCMAAALVGCEAVAAVAHDMRARGVLALGLGSAVLGITGPWTSQPVAACSIARALVDPRCGAPFPLFPWLGFPLVALGVGALCLRHDARATALRLAGASLVAGSLWALARGLPGQAGRFGSALAALKLALVFLLCALLAWLTQGRRLTPALARLSGETLFLYASHLPILYAGGLGLRSLVGHRLGLVPALLAALALSFACALGALGYPRLATALRRPGPGGTPRPQRSSPSG